MVAVKNRCLVAAVAIVISLTADALAQFSTPSINLSADRPQLTKEEQEKRKAVDDAYKSTINKLPDKKKPADPWGDIRSPAGEFVQATVAHFGGKADMAVPPGFPVAVPRELSCARAGPRYHPR